jgi:HK97 family phage portal protein
MGKLSTIFSALTKQDESRNPKRLSWYGSSGLSGTRVTEDSAMESSAFHRGVIYLSTQLAKLPWDVKDKNNNTVENNLSYYLNVSPNGETTSFKLKLFLIQCAIITGNGYLEIERDFTGRVIGLWPLNPNKVDAWRDQNNKLWYRVFAGGWSGETVFLEPRDIYHLANVYMLDSLTGQSTVAYAAQTLGISLGADTYANSLFTNGGLPSGVLTHKETMSDEAYARLKASWKEQYGGRKTGGTAILEDGVEYKPLNFSPDIMQFLESRKFSVTEIARFLGIPPQKLFDTDSAKYSNMEQAQLEVATDTIDSWCRNLESEADFKLLGGRRGGMRTELDISALIRGDSASRATYFQKMQQTGAITPNEIRKAEGRPSGGPAGDKLFIATNNLTPIDRVDEVIDAQIKQKDNSGTQPQKNDDEEETDKALKQAAIEFLVNK